MPQGPDHIYLLTDGNENYYRVENGIVLLSTSPQPLRNTPDKWREILITNQRNDKYFALDRSFSSPLEFVKDGAQIIRNVYYNRGSETRLYLQIAEQRLHISATEYGHYYQQIYTGEIDLSTFEHDGPKVTVSIMEGGPLKYIKARENTQYEFDLDGSLLVEMPGVELQQQASYIITNGFLPNDLGGATIEMTLLAVEAVQSIGATSQTRVKAGSSPSALWDTNQRFLETGAAPSQVKIKWDFKVHVELASGIGAIFGTRVILQLNILLDSSTLNLVVLQFVGGGDPLLLYGRTHHFQGEMIVTIPAGARCVLYMSATQRRDFTFFTYDNDGTFSINYTYVHPTSYIPAIRPFALLQQLISKITDNQYSIVSSVLSDDYRNIVVTSGDGIRNIEGAKIKTSLTDFFQSFNSIIGLGLGLVGGVLKMEKKSNWVDYNDPIDLGDIRDMAVKSDRDKLISGIKMGYSPQDYDDVNGKQEFNNTSQYTTPIKSVSNEYDGISKYRADCYGAEFTRINLEGKTTTDSNSDNDVFLLHISSATVPLPLSFAFKLDKSLNATASGLLSPATVYNLFLTPARNLRRNGNYIRSLFYKQDAEYIRYQTTDKNDQVVVDGIAENADIQIGSLPAPLFTPNLISITSKGVLGLSAILAKNPLKSFTWLWGGNRWYGIPSKITERVSDKEVQTYEMLSAPQNDLTKLEKVNG